LDFNLNQFFETVKRELNKFRKAVERLILISSKIKKAAFAALIVARGGVEPPTFGL
jgi:hypothetical protein